VVWARGHDWRVVNKSISESCRYPWSLTRTVVPQFRPSLAPRSWQQARRCRGVPEEFRVSREWKRKAWRTATEAPKNREPISFG